VKIQTYKIQNFIKNIANEKISGCLLFGPEPSVVSYRFDFIAKKISPDLSDPFLVTNISKEQLKDDKAILADEFFSLSMLGGRKLIIVKDADENCAKALDIIFSTQDFNEKSDNFILIQAGDLKVSSNLRKLAEKNNFLAAIPCYEDDEKAIKVFIEALLKNKKINFSADIVLLLIEKFGKNRQIIMSEVNKIDVFLGDRRDLNLEDVENLIRSESEISANEFVLNYSNRDLKKALANCEKLFSNNFEPITLIRYLSNYFLKLYKVNVAILYDGISEEEAIKEQRLFFKTEIEFRKHFKKLEFEFIEKILRDLTNLEIVLKSGKIAPKLAFRDFVLKSV